MQIRLILESLKTKLIQRHDFAPSGRSARAMRLDAADHASDTYPLDLFVAWLERCPEAASVLAEAGTPPAPPAMSSTYPTIPESVKRRDTSMPPNGAEQPQAPMVPQNVGPGTALPKQFRARVGSAWKLVELKEVKPGGVLLCQEVGATAYGGFVVVSPDCVDPDSRTQVSRWAEELTPQNLRWADGTPAEGAAAPVM